MMNGPEKSDSAIRATKPANKAASAAAEWVEQRAGTEGNAGQPHTRRTQRRGSVSQGLAWQLPTATQNAARSHESEAQGRQGTTPSAHARHHPRTGTMAEGGGDGILCLSCCAHEFPGTPGVPSSRHGSLGGARSRGAVKGRPHVGTYGEARRGMAADSPHPSSVARATICRQPPKVGAECPNRTFRSVRGVPGNEHPYRDDGVTARVLGHRQTKGAATDNPDLRPPRHISTLPYSDIRSGRFDDSKPTLSG